MDMEDILKSLGFPVCDDSMSVDDVLKKLPTDKSDLFLIDIQLRGDKSGIDLAQELNALGIAHMYVSSMRDRDVLAMARKTNALGFILKPFAAVDVFVALQMAIGKIESNQIQKSVYIKTGRGKTQILFQNILYAEADGHYTDLYTDNHKFTLRGNLKSVHETVLNSPL